MRNQRTNTLGDCTVLQQAIRSSHWRFSIKKLFFNFHSIHRKYLCWSLFLKMLQSLKDCNFIEQFDHFHLIYHFTVPLSSCVYFSKLVCCEFLRRYFELMCGCLLVQTFPIPNSVDPTWQDLPFKNCTSSSKISLNIYHLQYLCKQTQGTIATLPSSIQLHIFY